MVFVMDVCVDDGSERSFKYTKVSEKSYKAITYAKKNCVGEVVREETETLDPDDGLKFVTELPKHVAYLGEGEKEDCSDVKNSIFFSIYTSDCFSIIPGTSNQYSIETLKDLKKHLVLKTYLADDCKEPKDEDSSSSGEGEELPIETVTTTDSGECDKCSEKSKLICSSYGGGSDSKPSGTVYTTILAVFFLILFLF